jgi:hypothetical protein
MSIFSLIAGCILSLQGLAQQPFSSCSAAFVGSKMIVNEYTPKGKCRLAASSTGELSVQTVELSPTITKALQKIDFKVAIRDKATGTLHLFSDKTYQQLSVQSVLATCKKGDHIVILTRDNRYALPHNEILVL